MELNSFYSGGKLHHAQLFANNEATMAVDGKGSWCLAIPVLLLSSVSINVCVACVSLTDRGTPPHVPALSLVNHCGAASILNCRLAPILCQQVLLKVI